MYVNVTAAEEASSAEKPGPAKPAEAIPQCTSGIEDLFKDTTAVSPSLVPEKPGKDLKNDIMSLFEKVNISLSLLRLDIILSSKFCYFSILTFEVHFFLTLGGDFQLKEQIFILLFFFLIRFFLILFEMNFD